MVRVLEVPHCVPGIVVAFAIPVALRVSVSRVLKGSQRTAPQAVLPVVAVLMAVALDRVLSAMAGKVCAAARQREGETV